MSKRRIDTEAGPSDHVREAAGGTVLAWLIAQLLVLAAYVARPMSCMVALALENPLNREDHGSIDLHGFGVLGAVAAAVICAPLVLPLLMGRRAELTPMAARTFWTRTIAAILVLGSPMLIQVSYLSLTLTLPVASRRDLSAVVLASSALWMALVVGLCLTRRVGMPSIHAAFERSPRLSWASLATLATAKAVLLGLALGG